MINFISLIIYMMSKIIINPVFAAVFFLSYTLIISLIKILLAKRIKKIIKLTN